MPEHDVNFIEITGTELGDCFVSILKEADEWGALLWWSNSPDPKAVNVRNDIVRGLYKCRNAGFETDMEYLTHPDIIKASVQRLGYNLYDIGEQA